MPLTDMKRTGAENDVSEFRCGNESKYPWGLRIHLNEIDLEKLGIKELPDIESEMQMVALVEVVEVASTEMSGEKEHRRVELQIKEMAVQPHEQERQQFQVMYPGSGETLSDA